MKEGAVARADVKPEDPPKTLTEVLRKIPEMFGKIKEKKKKKTVLSQKWYEAKQDELDPLRKEVIKRNLIYQRCRSYNNKRLLKLSGRAFKKGLKGAKDEWWGRLNEELVVLEARGDSSGFYELAKSANLEQGVKDGAHHFRNPATGRTTTSSCEATEVCSKHFENLLGNVESRKAVDLEEALNHVERGTVEERQDRDFTAAEVHWALKRLKSNKTLGLDQVPTELLKIVYNEDEENNEAVEELVEILNAMFRSGKVYQEWKDIWISVLYKGKGDALDCNNYRGISLISHLGKLYSKMLDRRVNVILEDKKFLP
jgi:hypothetical protein